MVGATGVLGRHVVPRLMEGGYTVRAVVRDPSRAAHLSALGVEVSRGDLLAGDSLRPAVTGCDVVLHLATAIPPVEGRPDWTANDRIRTEGTQNLLDACRREGVGRYLQQSIAMLHARGDDAWTDETGRLYPTATTASAVEMEAMVRQSGLDWTILRGGYFYGHGTVSDWWRERAREGRLRLPGAGAGFVSLIHVSDMAAAVTRAVSGHPGRQVFCIVDDRPVTYAELFGHLAAVAGGPPPAAGGPVRLPSFRVANRRARRELGWRPHYATYRSGLLPT